MKLLLRSTTFLTQKSQVNLDDPRVKKRINEKADELQLVVSLIMNGIPKDWVLSATAEGLQVLQEIMNRDAERRAKINTMSTAKLFS